MGGGEPYPRILVFRDLHQFCASHILWRYRGLQILVLGSPDRCGLFQFCTTELEFQAWSSILALLKQKYTKNRLSSGFLDDELLVWLSSGRVHANPIQIHHYEATDVLIALAGCTKVVQIYFYCASWFSAYFTVCFFANPTLVDFRSTKPGIVQSWSNSI